MSGRALVRRLLILLISVGWFALAGVAEAQVSTATIQGTVRDDTGALPGATITARHAQSGFTHETVSGPDGSFTLGGLRPGAYEITIAVAQYKPEARRVEVLVGQAVTVNFRITPDVVYTENVDVVGDTRIIDTRTSQVTTNVTEEQVRYLPQNTRNFLNFAALAPGVRVSDNEFRKEITAGALPSQQTNVFIDGVSYKNDLILGGVVGQDSSRGSPFPQNAVQEFQVLTQNFKAEYEKAGSAIITAITRSGGNRFSGDIFSFYQDKALAENERAIRTNGVVEVVDQEPKPPYERWQWGLSAGGPIVQDRAQFFASYEENRQDRSNTVTIGTVTGVPEAVMARLRPYEGTFLSPFRERLLFGKVSMQPRSTQHAEVTYNFRNETDIRNFGGAAANPSYETAENVRNRVDSVLGKYQISSGSALNETYLSYQRYRWNPTAENYDIVGERFEGLLRIGGRDTNQHMVQERVSLRNDHSRFVRWNGSHTLKGGGLLSYADYQVRKELNGNPLFVYVGGISWDFPARAEYGVGDPDLSGSNWQVGLFAQDDWAINSRLTVNLGIRWDFESGMINTDYVTPESVRADTAPFVDDERYFTDGNDRSAFYGAWQPRVGFSYDLSGSGGTVLFGGFGRYFDRILYDWTLAERARLQYATRTFQFSANGGIRDGVVTIPWDPSYLSREGLDSLIERNIAPNPEVFLMDNEVEPPVSNQWSVGVRHRFGNIITSATYSGIRTKHLLTYIRGNRRPDGTCCLTVPGYSGIIVADLEGRKAWFDALYIQAERPFGVGGARWGFTFTYTLGQSEEIGGDQFSLDFPTVADYPRSPTSTDERHRVVTTGIVGLPWDFILSGIITLGSGTPYTITDESRGTTADLRVVRRNAGRPIQYDFLIPNAWAYRTVDLRIEKIFRFGERQQVSLAFEGFNIFSYDNFSGYDGRIATLPAVNPNYGVPSSLLDVGRRLQFGLRYGF
jgi:hypothetical protein